MSKASRVVHTARTRTRGARAFGVSRSPDGRLDIRFAGPDSDRIGTTPEHLFAAAWSACFETAIALAAHKRKVQLPAGIEIEAEVDLSSADDGHFLSARFNIRLPDIKPEVAQALIDEAHKTCPYSKATRDNIEVAITLIE